QEARNAIKVGDKVVTAGGIHGKVKEVGDTHFVLEIAENVRIKVEKASVYVSAEDTQTK
ncbi:MAG: preprotein translocase subunit YajC, partial [Dysgonomonas sp.]